MNKRELIKEINECLISGQKLKCIKLIKDFCSERKEPKHLGLAECKFLVDDYKFGQGATKQGKEIVNELIKREYITGNLVK